LLARRPFPGRRAPHFFFRVFFFPVSLWEGFPPLRRRCVVVVATMCLPPILAPTVQHAAGVQPVQKLPAAPVNTFPTSIDWNAIFDNVALPVSCPPSMPVSAPATADVAGAYVYYPEESMASPEGSNSSTDACWYGLPPLPEFSLLPETGAGSDDYLQNVLQELSSSSSPMVASPMSSGSEEIFVPIKREADDSSYESKPQRRRKRVTELSPEELERTREVNRIAAQRHRNMAKKTKKQQEQYLDEISARTHALQQQIKEMSVEANALRGLVARIYSAGGSRAGQL
jgi:hypothetical protein